MIGNLSAQIALLAFAAAIVAGLCAGNSPATVLSRALIAMLVTLPAGRLVAWTTKAVLRDHLRHKKLAIDKAHLDSVKASAEAGPGDDQSNTMVGTE
jgi:hypothetical protein